MLSILKRFWFIGAIALVIAAIIIGKRLLTKPPTINAQKPIRQNIEATVDVTGTVEASKSAELRFLAGGKLTYLPIAEGQAVRRGQTIASIDARDLEKNLQMSLNDYLTARSNFDQTLENYKDTALTNMITRLLDRNQYSLNDAVYNVELHSIAISNASLYSPLNGIVTSLPDSAVGSQVSATDTFEIVDPSSLQFRGEVDEADIGNIAIGQAVHIILDAFPNETLDANVESIALKASASTQSNGGTVFIVRAKIPEADIFHSRLGMNGTMKIVTNVARSALTIPVGATIDRGGKTYVKLKTGNTTREQEIVTGIENDTDVEVKSGLSDQDLVVVQ